MLQYRKALLALAGVGVTAFLLTIPASAQDISYRITNLGVLPGGTRSVATAINNRGRVVGWSDNLLGQTRAFFYSGGALTDLGVLGTGQNSYATGINNSNVVVGYSETGAFDSSLQPIYHAFRFASGTMRDMQTLDPTQADFSSYAYGIGGHGIIVGSSEAQLTAEREVNAFVESGAGLSNLAWINPPLSPYSVALGVNDDAPYLPYTYIVGQYYYYTPSTQQSSFRAFRLDGYFTMRDLGTFGGPNSAAYSVNYLGQVVGEADVTEEVRHPFIMDTFHALVDLGVLPGGTNASARGINSTGTVVGISETADDIRAFVWKPDFINAFVGKLHDLNDLISPTSGWTLLAANGLNDNGQVVGVGLFNGLMRAFLLTPITVSSLSITPTFLYGGQSATGRITLNTPAVIPTIVRLFSDNFDVIVPSTVTVPVGATSMTFPIITAPTFSEQSVFITATYSGFSAGNFLTIGTSTVSGTVTLSGCQAIASEPLIVELYSAGLASPDQIMPITLVPSGPDKGTFLLKSLASKRYTLRFRSASGYRWLAKNVVVDARNGNVANVQVTLTAGDANGDNCADIFDLATLAEAFNTTPGDARWNEYCDFNCDLSADIFDLALLAENFNTCGDPAP